MLLSLLTVVLLYAFPYEFELVQVLPYASNAGMKAYDVNHNGKEELICGMYYSFLEHFLSYWEVKNDTFVLLYKDTSKYECNFDIKDIDRDGKTEIVATVYNPEDWNIYLRIWESPDEHSFPSVLEWERLCTVVSGLREIIDFDNDGKYEIWLSGGNETWVLEQKNPYTNREWEEIIVDSSELEHPYGMVFGDFDGDDLMELARYEAFCDTVNKIEIHMFNIYENTGDNRYKLVYSCTLSTGHGIHPDMFTGDVNGDGVPEVYASELLYHPKPGYAYGCYLVRYYGVEKDRYEKGSYIIDSVFGQLSPPDPKGVCGDVDGDGRDEIVWVHRDIYTYKLNPKGRIEKCGEIKKADPLGESLCIFSYDFNQNGYAEIIWGTSHWPDYYNTLVYEIKKEGIHEEEMEGEENLGRFSRGELWMDCLRGVERVEIYDLLGRLVKVFKHPSQRIYWDGRDVYGNRVPSGVYFVRLEKDGKTVLKKILLMR